MAEVTVHNIPSVFVMETQMPKGIAFNYRLNQLIDTDRLRPPQSFVMQPEVGKLLVFPSWLQHMVYPFKGEGERRTVASNLNCWDVSQEPTQKEGEE